MSARPIQIAVIVPAYRVRSHIMGVVNSIPSHVQGIYVVDDACPDESGALVEEQCNDARVRVLRNEQNQGVGGAVLKGYREAIADGFDVLVKIDGDGQMDPTLIDRFVGPIVAGEADYTKGNRFYRLDEISVMPKARILGNAVLSLISKLSTGYWDVFDPTNGYTAVHAKVMELVPEDRLSKRYFFETDMLFRLGTIRAVVQDVPMKAVYGAEVSNLRIRKIVGEFLMKHLRNFAKRIFYKYYLRDMNAGTVQLTAGLIATIFGVIFGVVHWAQSASNGVPTTVGTVMLAALPTLLGVQFLLGFLGADITSVPKKALWPALITNRYQL
jgi:dolichol-phosphate mannosyltransferase